ncbi:MAG: DUF58 domain-containing protein [Chloroflexi bacterium]|nr:DUF58 domain-containing protein [Chloroflexota bacterium]
MALLAVAVVSEPVSMLAALALLALTAVIFARRVAAGLEASCLLLAFFLLPLLVAYLPFLPDGIYFHIFAAASGAPLMYLFDGALQRQAAAIQPGEFRPGKRLTASGRSLAAVALTAPFISVLVAQPAVLFTGLLLGLYLEVRLGRVYDGIPEVPVSCPVTRRRGLAGNRLELSLDIAGRAGFPLHACLKGENDWTAVSPDRLLLEKGIPSRLSLTFTPPLAGPSHPGLYLSLIDSRGLLEMHRVLRPVELDIIPKARFAEWLATKYLERSGKGTGFSGIAAAARAFGRGTDYSFSRAYEPRDSARNIDWKHSLKLSQLIVKEFTNPERQAAIIAVNLAAGSREEADRLAYDLIMTALTLAGEGIPAALAAYDASRVVRTTPLDEPRETVRLALALVREISVSDFAGRSLHPPDVRRLGRNLTLLDRSSAKPARRLHDILDFERRALETGARRHPATLALTRAANGMAFPATILVVSRLNHDAAALAVAAERFRKKAFAVIFLDER